MIPAMRTLTHVVVLLSVCSADVAAAGQTGAAPDAACAPQGVTYTRTTLYFGLARPRGTITEKEWKSFVKQEVTPRFPQGFTVWQADGQWRTADGQIARERAKVLLLVHAATVSVRDTLADLVASYKRRFEQESVLWETATVCAAF
jgi:hypothetical protein